MDSLRHILVGVDYSPCAASALREAARIASWNRASLLAVHVVLDEAVAEVKRLTGIDTAELLEGRKLRLQRFVDETLGPDAAELLQLRAIIGHPFQEIMALVEDRDVGLLVLGSHGAEHPEPKITGTLATKCVRKAPCRVLLVRESQSESFQRVTVAVDFSPTSRQALHDAARIARQDRAELLVVHVYAPAWKHFLAEGEQLPVSPQQAAAYLREVESQLADFTYETLEEYEGITTSAEVIEAVSPAVGLIRFLTERQADLAVIGTRGASQLDVVLLGSTAERVIYDSPCSVLTIKPEGFAFRLAPASPQ
ncbi:MAG TPA: universal stress protein [Verrucomicrobiales bacterium]|nr:universal stress protein [Verrucomicrobiales bacterium]